MKNIVTLLMVLALTSCASTEVIEARKAAIDKADHEECLSVLPRIQRRMVDVV